jgi:hypothetical membrane protein
MKKRPYMAAVGSMMFVVCWFIASKLDAGWVFLKDFPCMLGTSISPGRFAFNLGLVSFGSGLMMAGATMHNASKELAIRLHFLFVAISGAFAFMMAFINDDVAIWHEVVTMLAFVFGIASIGVLGIHFFMTGQTAKGAITAICIGATTLASLGASTAAGDTFGTIGPVIIATSIGLISVFNEYWLPAASDDIVLGDTPKPA